MLVKKCKVSKGIKFYRTKSGGCSKCWYNSGGVCNFDNFIICSGMSPIGVYSYIPFPTQTYIQGNNKILIHDT